MLGTFAKTKSIDEIVDRNHPHTIRTGMIHNIDYSNL